MSESVEGALELHIGRRSMAAFFLPVVAGCVALAAVFAAPAGAQVYPPNQCSLALSVSAAIPGQTIIAGSANCSPGFAAGATVTITIESDPVYLGTATADANGQFSTPVTIPEDTPLGRHTVVATGRRADGSTPATGAGLMIMSGTADARAEGAAGGLAFTGSDSLPLVWIALALLTVGTAFVLAVRRRAQARRNISA
jgi:hypothetical protein